MELAHLAQGSKPSFFAKKESRGTSRLQKKKAEGLSAKKVFALFEVCLIEAVLIAVFEDLEDHFAFADLEDGARLHVGA